ncbi:uncharacterized oxidoreductase YrbE-like [Battus philenor]|uniref:uncharacterized oxidoreductase YrbE-like n=1 Tax=Battus philenor TaxID=42288 RepID=UPI0035D040CD
MATQKFAGPSPYTLDLTYQDDDYLFTQFLNNVSIKDNGRKNAAPIVAAMFGLGRAGSIHLSSIVKNPRIILKYVIDDRSDRFDDLKKYWKLSDDITFITSNESEKVYKDKSVNVVFVLTPTSTHHAIVVNALNNNKDVFCEKPIAESIEDTRKCYETAKSKGRVLYCAYNRRFDPSYRSVKEQVRKGAVGHVQMIKSTTKDSPLPPIEYLKSSAGVFHDCIVHDIDMICWVLGEVPTKVQVAASALIPEIKNINDFDTIAYLLTFPSGAIAIGDNSRFSSFGHDQRLEVFGNKGLIKVDNEKPCPSVEYQLARTGVKHNPIFYSFPSRYKAAYAGELEHFLDVIQYGDQADVTSWQTLAVSKIATALEKSARTGTIVNLEWSKDEIPAEYS